MGQVTTCISSLAYDPVWDAIREWMMRDQRTGAVTEASPPAPYNVFICWSGSLSRKVATLVHEWLPMAIHAAEPFMSEENIEAGARGLSEIAARLSTIKVGLICVTADNQFAPWLNYETGSLAKTVDDQTRVIPLAFDIEKSQIKPPLGQFQAKKCTEEEMFAVARTINRVMDQTLPEHRLITAFNLSWPWLNARIEQLLLEHGQMNFAPEEKRSIEDMLEELIDSSREQSAALQRLATRPARVSDMGVHYRSSEAAMRRLAQYYGKGDTLTPRELLEYAPQFDDDDWSIIENAPFLYWYLTQYQGIKRKDKPEHVSKGSFDDVPF